MVRTGQITRILHITKRRYSRVQKEKSTPTSKNVGWCVLKPIYRRCKFTNPRVFFIGSVKTVLVDDSQPVANLMVVICTKIGITNHDEYSLVLDNDNQENMESKANYGTLTLKRRKEEKERDAKMDMLRKKLRTDDEGM